jgi:hypothetical protein
MCWVKCENIKNGLVDYEKVARFPSLDGIVEVSVSKDLVDESRNLLRAELIGCQDSNVLIELPTESARGDWRAWVDKDIVC